MIHVLVTDDQHLVREALKALLETELDLNIVARAADSIEATQKVTEQDVDVTLIDIEMPHLNGTDAIAKVSNHYRCLVVTAFTHPGYLERALQVSASGFLAKDTPPEQLTEAIRRIHSNLRVIDPVSAETSLFTAGSPLTDCEVEIARLILQGADTDTIAGQLFIAKDMVRNQVPSIIMKTNTSNHVKVAKTARDNDWL